MASEGHQRSIRDKQSATRRDTGASRECSSACAASFRRERIAPSVVVDFLVARRQGGEQRNSFPEIAELSLIAEKAFSQPYPYKQIKVLQARRKACPCLSDNEEPKFFLAAIYPSPKHKKSRAHTNIDNVILQKKKKKKVQNHSFHTLVAFTSDQHQPAHAPDTFHTK